MKNNEGWRLQKIRSPEEVKSIEREIPSPKENELYKSKAIG